MGSRNSTSDNQNAQPAGRGTPHPVGTRTTVRWYLFTATVEFLPLFEQDYDGLRRNREIPKIPSLAVLPLSLVLTHGSWTG